MRRVCCMLRATALRDRVVRDLPDLLRPGDVLVANDTRVIPAQLDRTARRRAHRHHPRPAAAPTAPGMRSRAMRGGCTPGDELRFDGRHDAAATVVARDADGGVVLAFNRHDAAFAEALRRAGALALPPYIDAARRARCPRTASDYQTMFAAHDGAVAAPTAGLHFTPALLAALDAARRPARHRHAACRRGHVPAGAHRRRCAASHARRARRDHASSRGRDQRRAASGRARGGGRHHQPAPAGNRRSRGRHASARSPGKPRCSSCRATGSAASICC